MIYFKQHSMIYHPRPYDPSYAQVLPANGEEISYTLPFGKQTGFIFLHAITGDCRRGCGLRFAEMARLPWIGRRFLPVFEF